LFIFLLTACIWAFVFISNPLSRDNDSCESTTGDMDCVQVVLQDVAGLGILMLIGILLPFLGIILIYISRETGRTSKQK
jgi:hypothetical protein